MSRPLPRRFSTKVVGVTFLPDYPDNVLRCERIQQRREARGDEASLPCVLIRDPENAHDPNAIQVHVPAVGMLGHIPAPTAERLAPELDDGVKWRCWLLPVRVHPDNPEQPGADIRLERVK